jgi:hypothetical protein
MEDCSSYIYIYTHTHIDVQIFIEFFQNKKIFKIFFVKFDKQINVTNVFQNMIASFLCATISQHNDCLKCLNHFLSHIFSFKPFLIMSPNHSIFAWNENYNIGTIFCLHHTMKTPKSLGKILSWKVKVYNNFKAF